MILVDSSVWIDFIRGATTVKTDLLANLLGNEELAIGDLILAEILQGCISEAEFERTRRLLRALTMVQIGGEAIAVEAARNFRALRVRGITVRKTIDTLIATRCIVDGHALLYSDRDFDPFVDHLGLMPCPAK